MEQEAKNKNKQRNQQRLANEYKSNGSKRRKQEKAETKQLGITKPKMNERKHDN